MILVADSGSTKVDWVAIKEDGSTVSVKTAGINPVFITQEKIVNILEVNLLSETGRDISEVYFYGAGVVSDSVTGDLAGAFKQVFPNAKTFAASDILAAARALCGEKPGIACIIGTGANSCFYDGEKMTEHVNAGGFILGDEASGGYFGRRLVSDFIKGLLPADMNKAFVEKFGLDYPKVVEKVYRQPSPNRFLASFMYFIEDFRNTAYVQNLLTSGFREFITRNIYQYDYKNYGMNIVGSVAYVFKKELEQVAVECGVKLGTILRSPIDGLINYHKDIYLRGLKK